MDQNIHTHCLAPLREASVFLEQADYPILALRVSAIVELIEDELARRAEAPRQDAGALRH